MTSTQPELVVRLLERCTQPDLAPLVAMALSRPVGKEVLLSDFFAPMQFLVYYERHDCPKLNRLHLVPRR